MHFFSLLALEIVFGWAIIGPVHGQSYCYNCDGNVVCSNQETAPCLNSRPCRIEESENCGVHNSSVECPGVGKYPVPGDSSRFMDCRFDNFAGTLEGVIKSCPSGLSYDTEIHECIPSKSKPGSLMRTSTFVCPRIGIFGDHKNCRIFYVCLYVLVPAKEFNCPVGSCFSKKQGACVDLVTGKVKQHAAFGNFPRMPGGDGIRSEEPDFSEMFEDDFQPQTMPETNKTTTTPKTTTTSTTTTTTTTPKTTTTSTTTPKTTTTSSTTTTTTTPKTTTTSTTTTTTTTPKTTTTSTTTTTTTTPKTTTTSTTTPKTTTSSTTTTTTTTPKTTTTSTTTPKTTTSSTTTTTTTTPKTTTTSTTTPKPYNVTTSPLAYYCLVPGRFPVWENCHMYYECQYVDSNSHQLRLVFKSCGRFYYSMFGHQCVHLRPTDCKRNNQRNRLEHRENVNKQIHEGTHGKIQPDFGKKEFIQDTVQYYHQRREIRQNQ